MSINEECLLKFEYSLKIEIVTKLPLDGGKVELKKREQSSACGFEGRRMG